MIQRDLKVSLTVLVLAVSLQAHAGPYAQLAQRVTEDGGVLQVVADGAFATRSVAQMEATALHLCRLLASEGVQITAVRIVTVNQQVMRVVGRDRLVGC